MRLDWLEDIVALLDTRTLTEAARRRNVIQPAFSRRLRSAEEALGAPILDRAAKPARLRPGVVALGSRLREAAAKIRQLRVDLRLAATQEIGNLVIAAQHSLAMTRAAGLVERFGTLGAVRGVRLRSANRDDCIRMAMMGKADIALVHSVEGGKLWHRAQEIEILPLATEPLVPVATRDEVARLSAGLLRVIAYPGDVFLGQVFAERLAPRLPATVTLELRAETALAPAAHSLVREGAGVAWLPEMMARVDMASGLLVDLSGDLPSTILTLCAVRPARASSAAAEAAWQGPESAGP